MNNSLLVVVLASGVLYGTPLLYAALGELLAEAIRRADAATAVATPGGLAASTAACATANGMILTVATISRGCVTS